MNFQQYPNFEPILKRQQEQVGEHAQHPDVGPGPAVDDVLVTFPKCYLARVPDPSPTGD